MHLTAPFHKISAGLPSRPPGFQKQVPVLLVIALFTLIGCEPRENGSQFEPADAPHPFEAWVQDPGNDYRYETVHISPGEGYSTHIVRMVSQRWLDEETVDQPEWWHWLTIVIPDQPEYDTALLWIGGGSRDSSRPESAPRYLTDAALATRSVTAEIHNIPFQPIDFLDDGSDPRYEDDLIAYGWRTFLEQGAGDDAAVWLARLPMTRAVARAMDTISEVTREESARPAERFVVSGASKRGWTAWTAAVFDERVIAVAPAVIDLLNMEPSFEHHWQAYGEWSPAIRDYENEGIMQWQNTQEYERLRELVDPYSYRNRLNLPKFIINAASDEFFLPDSWKFYWDDLPGEKYLRYVPNSGHSLDGSDAMESLITFYNRVIRDEPMPEFSWKVENGDIHIRTGTDHPPDRLTFWSAVNPAGRDFRLYVIDRTWRSRELVPEESGVYRVTVHTPEEGYRAGFVEAAWMLDGWPLKLTSGILVVPDTYPFPPFEPGRSPGRPAGSP